MPKDAYYFKHDCNAHADLKIKALRQRYGWQGYGWYWYIVENLRSEDGHKLNYDDMTFGALAEDLKCDPSEVKTFIDYNIATTKLFQNQNGHFFAARLLRDMEHLERVRQQAAEAGKKSGKKRSVTSTDVQRTFNGRSTELNAKPTDAELFNLSKEDLSISNKNIEEEDGGAENVFTLYESCCGKLNMNSTNKLNDWIDHYGEVKVIDAIKKADNQGKRFAAYIEGILEGRGEKLKGKLNPRQVPSKYTKPEDL